MAVEDWHPHRGCSDLDRIIFHDLLRFVHHFHFFFGIAIVEEDVDMGKAVKSDLMGYTDFSISLLP